MSGVCFLLYKFCSTSKETADINKFCIMESACDGLARGCWGAHSYIDRQTDRRYLRHRFIVITGLKTRKSAKSRNQFLQFHNICSYILRMGENESFYWFMFIYTHICTYNTNIGRYIQVAEILRAPCPRFWCSIFNDAVSHWDALVSKDRMTVCNEWKMFMKLS
jgi:hypothetical protein